MVKAGTHLGHLTRKWNPKMKPFIYGQKNNVHLLDLVKTSQFLDNVLKFLMQSASQGKTFLFVGTKKQAKNLIARAALSCDSYYVNEKWVGGLLTNWDTFHKLTKKLQVLEEQEKNGLLDALPKKELAKKVKLKEKLTKNFMGIKTMTNVPDVVIIIGQPEEIKAVKECNRLGIRNITVVDTDCNPTIADFIIPANDDSVPSIRFILEECVKAIQTGQNADPTRPKKPIQKTLQLEPTVEYKPMSDPTKKVGKLLPRPVQRKPVRDSSAPVRSK